MKLEAQNRPPIDSPTVKQVKDTIARLKSYGPCSYACLTDENNAFVQVGGGRVTCVLEKREATTGRIFRAFQKQQSEAFEDGTILSFAGGDIPLLANEWFHSGDVEEVFLAFLEGRDCPERVLWRDISAILQHGQ